jgi:hypothetical protein
MEATWSSLSAGALYDKLTAKGSNRGIIGNRILKKAIQEKYLSPQVGTKLAKKKADRLAQRLEFENLSAEGLKCIVDILESEEPDGVENSQSILSASEINANLRARSCHMALDSDCVSLLELIFGGPPRGERRAALDDKSTRALSHWKRLADEKFNNADWKPQNSVLDSRVQDIDPSRAPLEPFAPEKLRALFSSMRTQYTVFTRRYHMSGLLVEGNGEGDDDFFENFVKGDTVYFYMHLIYKDMPPASYLVRDLPSELVTDIGVSDASSSASSTPVVGSKRTLSQASMSPADVLKMSSEELQTQASLSTFYSQENERQKEKAAREKLFQSEESERQKLKLLREHMESNYFQTLPIEEQQDCAAKYNALFKKHMGF